jgi:hypothetical protein
MVGKGVTGNSGMEVSLDLCRHGAKPSLVVLNKVTNYSS